MSTLQEELKTKKRTLKEYMRDQPKAIKDLENFNKGFKAYELKRNNLQNNIRFVRQLSKTLEKIKSPENEDTITKIGFLISDLWFDLGQDLDDLVKDFREDGGTKRYMVKFYKKEIASLRKSIPKIERKIKRWQS